MRLEAWRPEPRTSDPLDRLPAPGRERRARIALTVLGLVIAVIAVIYLAITLEPALTGSA